MQMFILRPDSGVVCVNDTKRFIDNVCGFLHYTRSFITEDHREYLYILLSNTDIYLYTFESNKRAVFYYINDLTSF